MLIRSIATEIPGITLEKRKRLINFPDLKHAHFKLYVNRSGEKKYLYNYISMILK